MIISNISEKKQLLFKAWIINNWIENVKKRMKIEKGNILLGE